MAVDGHPTSVFIQLRRKQFRNACNYASVGGWPT
jgi:hypothetical protein